MKLLQLELPDRIAEKLQPLVDGGWFRNPGEAARLAGADFRRSHRLELLERQQREDIAWALGQKAGSD